MGMVGELLGLVTKRCIEGEKYRQIPRIEIRETNNDGPRM